MVHLLMSKRSPVATHIRLDSQHSFFEIGNDLINYLGNKPSGHIRIQAMRPRQECTATKNRGQSESLGAFPVINPLALRHISDDQIRKSRRHPPHCVEYAMANSPEAIAWAVDLAQIRRVIRGCTSEGISGLITPPKITGWAARLSGEIVGADVSYPFLEAKEGIDGGTTRRCSS